MAAQVKAGSAAWAKRANAFAKTALGRRLLTSNGDNIGRASAVVDGIANGVISQYGGRAVTSADRKTAQQYAGAFRGSA